MTPREQYDRYVGTRPEPSGDLREHTKWKERRRAFLADLTAQTPMLTRVHNWLQSQYGEEFDTTAYMMGGVLIENDLPDEGLMVDMHCMTCYQTAQARYAEMNGRCMDCGPRWHDKFGTCRRTLRQCTPYLLGPLFECYGQLNEEVEA